jgi:arylsulfatase A-like enzyme
VIFFSDNGGSPVTGAINTPLSGSKYNLLEGGIRVPFIMRFPSRLPQGKVYPHVISSLDIVPTCLEAAGIGLPPDNSLDGLSLYQELSQSSPKGITREALFWQFKDQFAVRDGDWKLVQTRQRPEGVQLYNLADDLAEQENLAEQHPEVFARLMGQYEEWKSNMGEIDKAEP